MGLAAFKSALCSAASTRRRLIGVQIIRHYYPSKDEKRIVTQIRPRSSQTRDLGTKPNKAGPGLELQLVSKRVLASIGPD